MFDAEHAITINVRLFACAKCFATRTVTRAKPQPRTRIVAMTIIQYFAALLAMGALLAYFVRARTERARRDAPPHRVHFPFTRRVRRPPKPTDVRSYPACPAPARADASSSRAPHRERRPNACTRSA
jgi:hypothetical protein